MDQDSLHGDGVDDGPRGYLEESRGRYGTGGGRHRATQPAATAKRGDLQARLRNSNQTAAVPSRRGRSVQCGPTLTLLGVHRVFSSTTWEGAVASDLVQRASARRM